MDCLFFHVAPFFLIHPRRPHTDPLPLAQVLCCWPSLTTCSCPARKKAWPRRTLSPCPRPCSTISRAKHYHLSSRIPSIPGCVCMVSRIPSTPGCVCMVCLSKGAGVVLLRSAERREAAPAAWNRAWVPFAVLFCGKWAIWNSAWVPFAVLLCSNSTTV